MLVLVFCGVRFDVYSQAKRDFRIVAFFTAKNDQAHISFVKEAVSWFLKNASARHYEFDTTRNWGNLNDDFLSRYRLVIFLDTRPEGAAQRIAFQRYMEKGGSWMGFHFSAFALTPSAYPQNWDWYHNEFLGSGEYVSNTWRPTPATLKVEDPDHPVTKDLPLKFLSAANEWYRWKHDLRTNKDIRILLSVHDDSFPLGTGPKPHEIWYAGYYPVAWTNTKYKMVYFNMGHNDIDYEGGTGRELSFTFSSETQNQLIVNAIEWLVRD